ncbi:MAG: nickel pincer cofactor biosynthesis protein LarC [Elusimicrobiota bacterium]|jgi:uncharacterized protein (TIGR00299 family) protein|nr:nickel pincer cofactor biosynthesis protein LarC [Elusimicrobiota bacterium]
MKTLYFECAMGAAGDMLAAALFELIDDKEDFLKQLNSLGIEGLKTGFEQVSKLGIKGTRFEVSFKGQEEESLDIETFDEDHKHNHDHDHNNEHKHDHQHEHEHSHHHTHKQGLGYKNIKEIIETLPISESVRKNVLAVYHLIAEAEAEVHGQSVEQIHFHELGNMDAVADIVTVCILIEKLGVKEILASPIHVGSGFVKCAHGIMPVPAPATANILRGVPTFGGAVKGELCTPTGAALLKHFVKSFTPMTKMKTLKIGYGMGKKDFAAPNCLRAFLAETDESSPTGSTDRVAQLCANLDDMTGEAAGFAANLLLKEGAKDVFNVPVFMKKNRPSFLLVCLCDEDKADFFAGLILRHTSTFGVRKTVCDRYILDREISTVKIDIGDVRVKTGRGWGIKKSKAEFDDLANLSQKTGLTIKEIEDKLRHKLKDD